MPHDVIDNRESKLVDHINTILDSTDQAKFAIGYFFLSGFGTISNKLDGLKKIQILIGNTSSRETIEQLCEGYKRLEMVKNAEEKDRYLTKSQRREREKETTKNLRRTVELMDQTDDEESLVQKLIRLIQEKRIEVKVFTKGRLHAKAYIFDYKAGHYESGIAIIGSSNLTLSGLSHNTELNVVVHGNENHAQLTRWFEDLWNESTEFDETLMHELKHSWAAVLVKPYDIYMKTLYALVADRLEEKEAGEVLWDDEITSSLADFQKSAVKQSIQMIRDYGGAFVADVVGLGKSYIGAGVVKHFRRVEGVKPLIICPKPLVEMWEDYNDFFDLNAKVLSMSLLQTNDGNGSIFDQKNYQDRDFVLIDESHHFRYHTTQRYDVLESFLMRGMKKVCLLTATPRNKSARDVYNQIKLFHHDDVTSLPIDPPNLKDYFKEIDEGRRKLQDLLVHILIRRTRRHILRWYGYAEDTGTPLKEMSDAKVVKYLDGTHRAYVMVGGKHQFFPRRELETLRYSIEETYSGLYDEIRHYIGRSGSHQHAAKPGAELTFARYGLWHYVKKEKQDVEPYRSLHRAGINLRGLIRVMLFKRFESSVYAFKESLRRLKTIHEVFLDMLKQGFVPAGEEAQKLLYESDNYEETDLVDRLREYSGRYAVADFNGSRLQEHLEADRKLLQKMIDLVEPITPDNDNKLQTLIVHLKKDIPKKTGKILIFTQYADTAKYLFENLNPNNKRPDIQAIYGTDRSKARIAARFAPNANRHIRLASGETEIRMLVATDVMSEGLNLQDGDVIVNYDLHWNPVKLIQRFGRIDRIGSENDIIWAFNFLPERKLDRNLGLTALLRQRISEIHETIGEDSAILDKDEQLNPEAMFAIYEKKGDQLSFFEDQESDFIDLNEAEEMLRSLRKENPEEFERIAELRDGIRSARGVLTDQGRYVFCQAGKYQQLFLTDPEGKVTSRDLPTILTRIKCPRNEPATILPKDHNAVVMKIKHLFEQEVKQRVAQQQYSLSLSIQQRYALRELRALFTEAKEDDLKSQIVILENAFKKPVSTAIKRQLNVIRRNGVTGKNLLRSLTDIYFEYGMSDQDFQSRIQIEDESENIPRIICSEALV